MGKQRYTVLLALGIGVVCPAQQWYMEVPDAHTRITATRGAAWVGEGVGYFGFGIGPDGEPAGGYHTFDPVNRTYSGPGSTYLMARAHCTVFHVGGESYVGLGTLGGPSEYYGFQVSYSDQFDKIVDQASWPYAHTPPYPGGKRINPFSFVINDLAYVGGGQSVDVGGYPYYHSPEYAPVQDMYVYDHVTDTWTALGNTPVNFLHAQAFVINGIAYVIDDQSTALWAYDPTTDTWTSRAPYPGGPRQGATVLVRQGKAYMGSGYLNGYQNTYYEYDPVTNTWAPGPTIWDGRGRKYALSFTLGDDAYLVGGEGPDDRTRYEVWRLGDESGPLPNDTLVQRAFMPAQGRKIPIAFSIGDKGYFGGGSYVNIAGEHPLTDLWMYDPATDTWTGRAGMPFNGTVGLSLNGIGYVMSERATDNFYAYDPVADAWSPRADRPNGTMETRATGFAVEGKLYIWGGMPTGGSQFWSYDPATDTWEQRPDRPIEAYYGTGGLGFAIGNKGYIAGGWVPGTQGSSPSRYTSCYDPATETWTSAGSFVSPPSFPAIAEGQAFAIGNRAYVISGDRHIVPTNFVAVYDPIQKQWTGHWWGQSGYRYQGIGLAIGGKGYVFGGRRNMYQAWAPYPQSPDYSDHGWTLANDLWEFDPTIVGLEGMVLLDGPYDADEQLMGDELNAQELLPLTDPYAGLGYPYPGANFGDEQLQMPEGSDAASIVDRIVVELRDADDPSMVVATRHVWLHRDGTIVDMDGSTRIRFTVPAGDYYIAVRHRNHLGAMTATPRTFSSDATVTVDFTSPALATYGTEARKVGAGTARLWPGDANFDRKVSYTGSGNDRDRILQLLTDGIPTSTVDGYFTEDTNMDGVVKYAGAGNDRDLILETIGGEIPTVVRQEQVP